MCASDDGKGFVVWARRGRAVVVGSLAGVLLAGSALAQQAPSREQEQLRRMRLQLQQLQAAQTTQTQAVQQAQADAAAARQQLAAAQAELRRVRGSLSETARAAADAQQALEVQRGEQQALQGNLTSLRSELDTTRRNLAQQQQALAETQSRLGRNDTAMAELRARQITQAQGMQACLASNEALHALGNELLQRYAGKTVAEVVAQNEPFLQLQRVALENLMQGYRDKLDMQALRAAPDAARAP